MYIACVFSPYIDCSQLQTLTILCYLPLPHIQFNYRPADADWSREMRGNPLISTVDLHSYLIVFTQRDQEKAQDLVQTLKRVAPPMGFQIGRETVCRAPDDRTDTFLRVIRDSMEAGRTQMVSCKGGAGVFYVVRLPEHKIYAQA